MTGPHLLVVEDDEPTRRAVAANLRGNGYLVQEAGDVASALGAWDTERPDAIVLDLGLPDMTGADVCRDLRAWTSAPILVLSARHSDTEKAALLDAGADDYVTKPFSTVELQARVRALIRRHVKSESSRGATTVTAGDITIDLVARTVTLRGEEVHLTPIEWELLRVLSGHVGRTLTHQQLFNEVWHGRSYGDAQAYLRVHVAHLRRKLEADPMRPRHIRTEPGIGYRFVAD